MLPGCVAGIGLVASGAPVAFIVTCGQYNSGGFGIYNGYYNGAVGAISPALLRNKTIGITATLSASKFIFSIQSPTDPTQGFIQQIVINGDTYNVSSGCTYSYTGTTATWVWTFLHALPISGNVNMTIL